MNEEIDDFNIYHQDFTTASEWEVFIARIEEILNDWKLNKDQHVAKTVKYDNRWLQKCEELKFYGSNFTVSYIYLKEKLENEEETSDGSVHKSISFNMLDNIIENSHSFMDDDNVLDSPFPISNWYSLKKYVLITSHTPLVEENQIKLIVSSMNIAVLNVECVVPIFIKIREHWQHNYLGIFEDSDLRTNFDTIHLKKIPSQCYHLTGLLNLFKGKIASPQPIEPVNMSAKFSYDLLKTNDKFSFSKPNSTELIDVKKWIDFGAKSNPIIELNLNVIWPKFYEDAVIDSATYTDFDPLMAPIWTVTVVKDSDMICFTNDILNKIFKMLDLEELLMDTLGLSKRLGLENPLNKITDTAISRLVKVAMGTQNTEFKGPINDNQMMTLLYFLFPDAGDENSKSYPQELVVELKVEPKFRKQTFLEPPPDNLVTRLCHVVAKLLDVGGLPYVAHFWYEFTQELQYRWEHRILIPGIAPGVPNPRSSLLHQKLQLLNCCIKKAKDKEENSSDDEEFFDCDEQMEENAADKPSGRLKEMPGAKLKNGQPLFIPRTQEPPPKTEDQLDEDTELMLRLGTDSKGSEMRAKMLSASLLSDMEAFKAANPGAELCDFVQWYSPRDWLPDDGGTLGERMLLADNPWVEAWSKARAVPVSKQRRLFDEWREADLCLQFLRSRTVCQIGELILPILMRSHCGLTLDKRRAYETRAKEIYEAEKEHATELFLKETLGTAQPGRPLDAEERNRLKDGVSGTTCRREFTLRAKSDGCWQLMRAVLADDILIAAATTRHIVLH